MGYTHFNHFYTLARHIWYFSRMKMYFVMTTELHLYVYVCIYVCVYTVYVLLNALSLCGQRDQLPSANQKITYRFASANQKISPLYPGQI